MRQSLGQNMLRSDLEETVSRSGFQRTGVLRCYCYCLPLRLWVSFFDLQNEDTGELVDINLVGSDKSSILYILYNSSKHGSFCLFNLFNKYSVSPGTLTGPF